MSIKVMSQNIMCWECEPNGLFVNRRPLIKKAVENADVIGFQEVRPNWEEWLKEDLPEFDSYLVYRTVKNPEGTPIYWKKDRLSMLECGHFWLSETPDVESLGWDAHCVRIACWCLFEDKNDKKRFVFVNTHLDHRGENARINGIKQVCDFIKNKFGEIPLVLTGDFNALPDSPTIAAANALLTDARTAFGIKEFPATFHGFEKNVNSCIDYIYLSSNVKCTDFKTVIEKNGDTIQSDHYGILAEIEI